MGFLTIIKILIVPALIALALYALLAYALIPLYRNHLHYNQYIPVNILSEQTSTVASRATAAVTRFFMPRSMRWRMELERRGSDGTESLFGAEEGESMVGFDVEAARRDREGLGVGAGVLGGRPGGGLRGGEREMDSQRRLSRDLEEGFKDESEDEEGGDDRRR